MTVDIFPLKLVSCSCLLLNVLQLIRDCSCKIQTLHSFWFGVSDVRTSKVARKLLLLNLNLTLSKIRM